jgi:hypothetical protein
MTKPSPMHPTIGPAALFDMTAKVAGDTATDATTQLGHSGLNRLSRMHR